MRNFRLGPHSSTRCLAFSSDVKVALVLGFALIAALISLPFYVGAQSEAAATETNKSQRRKAEWVPGELLVRFRPGSALASVKSRASTNLRSLDGRPLQVEINRFGGSDLIEGLMLVRVAAENAFAALKALSARADVLYAEPNYIRHLEVVPNDTHYADSWGLKNSSAWEPGISAEAAWDSTTGSPSVVVGVIDSGIDTEHRDLKDNIFVNAGETPGNGVDDDNNGFVDDVNGWDFVNHDRTVFDNANEDAHGTHVAGTIGARGNNSVGVAGVNWDVQLMPIKALGLQGGTDAGLLEAFNYAKLMRQRGVNLRVLNNSYGGQGFSQSLGDGIKELGASGILFIAAAGNSSLNTDFVPFYPASYDLPNVISVAASTDQNVLADSFSNRGAQSVHLVAPGRDILSTTPRGYSGAGLVAAYTEPDGSTYSNFSGTSMASPHVAGAAALACAVNPGISLEKLRAAVLFGVDESDGFTNRVITGGRLNANRTIQLALEDDTTSPAAAANLNVTIQTGRALHLRWFEAGDDNVTGRASLDEISFIDQATGERFLLKSTRSLDPGAEHQASVSIPVKHATGQLLLRTFDNVGNISTVTMNVTVPEDESDPYVVTTDQPGTLTAQNSGIIVDPKGDDVVSTVDLPFNFPFFGATRSSVLVSSNGAIYVPIPPDYVPVPNGIGSGDGAVPTRSNLEGMAMIAGMWADLRTDRNSTDNVYMVQPDRDRVIFRWQGVTYGSETPINFEIELRRDGTIQTRYGAGNQNLRPVVVGISGSDREAYLVPTHTSEAAPLSLTHAQSVTFALRNPPSLRSELVTSITAHPEVVEPGREITYNVRVRNLGPLEAEEFVMTDVLAAGTTFVSCTTNHFTSTSCTGPPVGTHGTVTGRRDILQPVQFDSGAVFTIVVRVNATPGTVLANTASASSYRPDPNPSNNSASVTSMVVGESFFGGVRAISAGHSHASSVRNDGTVWNWGAGDVGQLGDGGSGDGVRAVTPVQVAGLEGFTNVADGNGFVLALKSDGTVWSWGLNGNGQLGDGTTMQRARPVQTRGLVNVMGISAGSGYSAALKSDGTVWIWGTVGPFGLGTFPEDKREPAQVPGITNVTAILAGSNHMLLLKNDKTVWAFGANSSGELGDGTTTRRPLPVAVNGLTNVTHIAAGIGFSLALKEDGVVWGWGENFNGQLGPGGGNMNSAPHPFPIQNTGLPSGITNISAGGGSCLALALDGTVWSWGDNSHGQLGQGPLVNQNNNPRQIPNFNNVIAIAEGISDGVALKSEGTVWSWGANSRGEVGDGTTTRRSTPVHVTGVQTASTPWFNPQGGTFTSAIDVTITCATPGVTIHFTTNDTEPTESDPVIVSGSSLHLTGFTMLRARAWKAGWISSSTNFAQFNISIAVLPLQLLLDESGPATNQLAALDSVLFLRDPFPVINGANLFSGGSDPNTRVIIFVTNLQLTAGETAASVVVNLTANGQSFDIAAEDVRTVPNFSFTQVMFRLPDNLPAGMCAIKLRAHNQTSNIGTIRIRS